MLYAHTGDMQLRKKTVSSVPPVTHDHVGKCPLTASFMTTLHAKPGSAVHLQRLNKA